jgi:hypothetical protein
MDKLRGKCDGTSMTGARVGRVGFVQEDKPPLSWLALTWKGPKISVAQAPKFSGLSISLRGTNTAVGSTLP